ncbi:MAG: tetratricopeptide repeat protein [Planctomycetia bacterium]|nr:tetratricopeptide repeat protein [Planctomycetia bacterium]
MEDRNDPAHETSEDARLLNLLVQYDEALAEGTLSDADTQTPPDVSAELADQLVRGKQLLELLAALRFRQPEDPPQPERAAHGGRAPSTANLDLLLGELRKGAGPRSFGRFVILREIGLGGHGVVLLAFDPLLKRHVALKLPRSEALLSASLRARFLREARATARLTHPNLVSVHEAGEVGLGCYIASAYCAGPSLGAFLKQQDGPLAPTQAAELVAQLADGVHYAHSRGVLHRDIKPSNVLLEPAAPENILTGGDAALPFVPKLVDFGLAKLEGAAGSDTQSGVAMGTPGYMAPEQAEGRLGDIGAATDVYGLGAVLYEALTGGRPFAGASDADCVRRILNEEPARLTRANPRVPSDLEAICLKCLEKRPVHRYKSARALSDDLRRYLAGEPISARRVTRVERLGRWARRNPGVAALSAAVLLLLTALAVGSTVAAVRIEAAREQAQAAAGREAAAAELAQSESKRAQSVADFLEGMLRAADPVGLEGFRFRAKVDSTNHLTAADILRQGAEKLHGGLDNQPAVQAKLMAVIGSVYVTLGMVHEAEPLLEQSLRLRERLHGEEHLETAESLHDLASLRFANFDFTDTKRLLRRALAIRTKLLGPAHADTIRTKFNLAWLVVTNGHETEAEKAAALPLMEEVLEFHRRRSDSPTQYAFALIGLAMLRYEVDKKPLEAATLLAEANRVLSANGDSDIAAGLTLMLQSYFQRRLGNAHAAVKTMQESIARMRQAGGERHPLLVWPNYLLAEALIEDGKPEQALQVYRDTARFCQQIYDEHHRAVGLTKARMAEPLLLMNDPAQAESALVEALDIFRREDKNLPNRQSCVEKLLSILDRQDRHAEANELCRQELLEARALGEDDESRAYHASILHETAHVREALGEFAGAKEALGEAAAMQQSLRGAHDAGVGRMLRHLALLELADGTHEGYRATCRKLVSAFAADATSQAAAEIAWTCVLAPDAVDDPRQLVEMADRARLPPRERRAYETLLGAALYRAGRFEEAISHLAEGLRLQEKPDPLASTAHDAGRTWAGDAFLSMAYARLGEADKARIVLDRAVNSSPPSAQDEKRLLRRDRIARDVLIREAQQLIEPHVNAN